MTFSDAAKGRLVDLLEYRGSQYAILSNAFVRESSPEAIRELIDHSKSALNASDSEPLEELDARLAQAMADLDEEPFDQMCTKTRTEYVRMFVGLRHIVVPAHESMYVGNSKRMMTPVTFDVRQSYAHAGFEVIKKNLEPDDHIGTELEFMAVLCQRSANSVRDGGDCAKDLEGQKAFLEMHLNKWVPEFAQATVENDESGYYGPWADYLQAFIEQDNCLLQECRELAGLE